MRVERRFSVPVRPPLFLGGLVLFVAGLYWGLNWSWSTQRFGGAVLVQILVPGSLFSLNGPRALGLLVAFAGLGLLLASFGGASSRRDPGLVRTWMRFHPAVFLLGVFLVVYGAIFLFDVGISADRTPVGTVFFVSFNYAYLSARAMPVLAGTTILCLGALLLAVGSFSRPLPPGPDPAGSGNEPVAIVLEERVPAAEAGPPRQDS